MKDLSTIPSTLSGWELEYKSGLWTSPCYLMARRIIALDQADSYYLLLLFIHALVDEAFSIAAPAALQPLEPLFRFVRLIKVPYNLEGYFLYLPCVVPPEIPSARPGRKKKKKEKEKKATLGLS
jgi:hypothetical protein